jgi:DNA-binding NtrC family response regulator
MPAKRVLVVDGDAKIRLMVVGSLRDAGFHVTEASDGDIAASQLQHQDKFDVLLTDLRIPGERDGVEVMTCARELDPTIAVVIVSGYADHLTKRLAALQQPFEFMSKPYRLRDLIERVKHTLA